MAFSLYDAIIPNNLQILGALKNVIAKAQDHCTKNNVAESDLLNASLCEDMFPFAKQITQVYGHSIGAIEGVRKGVFGPNLNPPPTDFAGLTALIDEAIAKLNAVTKEEVDGFIGTDTRFEFGTTILPFTSENFLLSFSTPNFYFHATTAYDILRNRGVAVGKRDYMGMPRIKM